MSFSVEKFKFKTRHFLVIAGVVFLSTYKTLGFYFWHDDFTWFYKLRLNECQEVWPYNTICPLLKPFYGLFGYTAWPYYLIGIILLFIAVVGFYFLTKNLLLVLIFSTSYIGAGVFLEAHSPVFVIPSLIFLIFSLVLLQNRSVLAFLFFAISILISPARSAGNLLPFLAYLWLFNQQTVKRKIAISLGAIAVFLLAFSGSSVGFKQEISLSNVFLTAQTFGSLLIPDAIGEFTNLRAVFGFAVPALLFGIALRTKDMSLRKNLFFSLIWIASMYFPFWLRINFRLSQSHRYLFFVFPGILLAWGSFTKYKWWKFFSLIILILSIAQSNIFFGQYLKTSFLRADFYKQLHINLPILSPDTYVFFDSPQSIRNEMTDFFRVGQYPSEAALGTEYGVDYKSFKLVDNERLTQLLKRNELKRENISSFYYDSHKLVPDSVLPSQKTIKLRAALADFSLPFSQGCSDCRYGSETLSKYLSFATESRAMKKKIASIAVTDYWEETVAESLIDEDINTYWAANRQLWWENGNKPVIKISFAEVQQIAGIIIYSNSTSHLPDKIDGFVTKGINNELVAAVFILDKNADRDLELIIKSTLGGDMPVIKEIDLIPSGYADFDLKLARNVIDNPAADIRTVADKKVLIDYLAKGVEVCLIWEQKNYGSGSENFILYVDGNIHEYKIWLPAMGIGEPEFKIGCLNYPASIETLLSF